MSDYRPDTMTFPRSGDPGARRPEVWRISDWERASPAHRVIYTDYDAEDTVIAVTTACEWTPERVGVLLDRREVEKRQFVCTFCARDGKPS